MSNLTVDDVRIVYRRISYSSGDSKVAKGENMFGLLNLSKKKL